MVEFDTSKIGYSLKLDGKYYNTLDIEGFSHMMRDPSYCYKFYWLEAIVQLIAEGVKETTFDEINISDVSDGVYIGEYDVNFIYAKVEVRVQNGEITDIIILEHRHEHGKAAETVINEIVDEQRIDVDAVSGATNSSIVIKKAVENALKSGL